MTLRVSVSCQNAMCNAGGNLLDSGTGAGYFEFYTGTQPASVATAATGTLLGTVVCAATAFGASVNGTKSLNASTPDVSADSDGSPGWFRAYNGDGTAIFDGSVTAIGGGGDMETDNINWLLGDTISISTFTFNVPLNQS